MKPWHYILIILGLLALAGLHLELTKNRKPLVPEAKTETPTQEGLANYGPAPEFVGITKWLQSDPLTLEKLRGKVVLVDFWTYSCINCIRTLPYVTKWYDTYKDKGLVVVGVHTPEFAFEKLPENVQKAIAQYNIHYPVAQDNDYKTWNAYRNQYWPAEYLIDQGGGIVHVHFGEGKYEETEGLIRQLLGLDKQHPAADNNESPAIGSPEMYFGTARLANLASTQSPSEAPKNYTLPKDLPLNTFALAGQWQFGADKATLTGSSGKILLKFRSGKVHLVAASAKPVNLAIRVDGQDQPPVTVSDSKLYTLFSSGDYGEHTIEITIPQSGFEAFTFTFG